MEGCYLGGPMHIATEDGNISDDDLRWIAEEGAPSKYNWGEDAANLGAQIAAMMLTMTGTQRRKLVNRSYYPD